jgi:tetratricopeptide (TPR) repeat protein
MEANMKEWRSRLPNPCLAKPARLIYLEAPAGQARRRYLETWLRKAAHAGANTHFLSCCFETGGPWAGLSDLLRSVLPRIERENPTLLQRHAGELTLVLPTLRRRLTVQNPTLTDLAVPEEKVRNYPTDRAFRIVHGLIDLFAAWKGGLDAPPWVVVCDNFEDAGRLVRMFFPELIRRRGEVLNLTLVLTAEPGTPEPAWLSGEFERIHVRPRMRRAAKPLPEPRQMEALACDLEAQCRADELALSENLPQLIYYWKHSGSPERSLVWQGFAFGEYNHFGLYEDALRYGGPVLANLDVILGSTDLYTRWHLVGSMANCYLALNRPEEALRLIEEEALPKIDDAADRSRAFYVLAMIHSRFLPRPNFVKAEECIGQGIEALECADIAEHEKYFVRVFLLNGLAYVRNRQGKADEAIEICRSGFELLNLKLRPDQHRLHRSVLLYNMAQVYAALRSFEQAAEYLGAAMEFDPNYSEYYNERGNAYLNLGRLDEAVADYWSAIRLSAPYQEVWTNLGQAYRSKGNFAEAIDAYSRALDLEPHQLLPRLGRAQAYDALGARLEALADYSAALDLDPNQPLVLANRAALLYELGRLAESVEDLNRALVLSPDNADLLYNRSVALADMGRHPEAARDLRSFLEMRPETGDQDELEARIASFTAGERAAPTTSFEGAVS